MENDYREMPPALSSAATGALLRAFFRIADKWRLSDDQERELLGLPSPAVLKQWKDGTLESAPSNVQNRMICILDIYLALHTLFPNSAHADDWLHWTNKAPMFGGDTALGYILQGNFDSLQQVRHYLNAQCG